MKASDKATLSKTRNRATKKYMAKFDKITTLLPKEDADGQGSLKQRIAAYCSSHPDEHGKAMSINSFIISAISEFLMDKEDCDE